MSAGKKKGQDQKLKLRTIGSDNDIRVQDLLAPVYDDLRFVKIHRRHIGA
jgi:hypothetical protein